MIRFFSLVCLLLIWLVSLYTMKMINVRGILDDGQKQVGKTYFVQHIHMNL